MTRIACALILVAMGLLLEMLVQTNGRTAIAFSFLGAPALGAGLLVYLISLRRRPEQ